MLLKFDIERWVNVVRFDKISNSLIIYWIKLYAKVFDPQLKNPQRGNESGQRNNRSSEKRDADAAGLEDEHHDSKSKHKPTDVREVAMPLYLVNEYFGILQARLSSF